MCMTTGILERLKETGNIKKWLKQDIIRSYGICISMRDDGPLTEEQILKKLKESDAREIVRLKGNIEHYEKLIIEIEQEIVELTEEKALAEWDAMLIKYNEKRSKALQEKEEFDNTTKIEHEKIVNQLINSENELVRSVADTVKQQLSYLEDGINAHVKYAEYEKPSTIRDAYFEFKKLQLNSSLETHKKRLEEYKIDLEFYQPLAVQYENYCKAIDTLEI